MKVRLRVEVREGVTVRVRMRVREHVRVRLGMVVRVSGVRVRLSARTSSVVMRRVNVVLSAPYTPTYARQGQTAHVWPSWLSPARMWMASPPRIELPQSTDEQAIRPTAAHVWCSRVGLSSVLLTCKRHA